MNKQKDVSIKDWQDKKVAVLGFGVEGLAAIAFLHKKGSHIWALDKKEKSQIDKTFLTPVEKMGVQFQTGEKYLENLSQFDVIIRSPGVRKNLPELLQAEEDGVVITSQTRIFFDLCPAKIIGVTGTKGKGTTATLIYEMLKASGKDVYLGGNVGIPPLTFLDKLTPDSWVVLELSSFQLQDLHKSPHIAVMLMVTSDHMDYHETVEEYVAAKRNILLHQTESDFAILNRDYPASNESDIYTQAKVFYVTREREVDEGAFVRGRAIWYRRAGTEQKIIDTDDLQLKGRHNHENICAAVTAAFLAKAKLEGIVEALKTFKGLEHRLEFVREVNGVKYYDDSFSTTPETAIAAIEAFKEPEVLVLGGSSKKSDFTQLAETIKTSENIKAIIGVGEGWEEIKSSIQNQRSNILVVEGAKDMKTIVQAAAKIAIPGDVVLLSPACASFGMFKDYKDRGSQFKKEVASLQQ